MKLCFFTYGGGLYGANLSMVDLITGLREQGVESMVLYPEGGLLTAYLEKSGIKGVCSPFKGCVQWRSKKPGWHPRRWMSIWANAVRAVAKAAYNRSRAESLAEICAQFGADAIVTNTAAINIGLLVAQRLGLPHVWHVREFGDLDWDFYPDFGLGARRRQMERSARVMFVSRAVARHHLTQCGLPEAPKFKALYDGIASESELARRREIVSKFPTGDGKGPLVFGIAGYVKISKGQFEAVSALKQVVDKGLDARLLVAGQGATEELRSHAELLGVGDRVEILEHVRSEEMETFYRRIHCGLMCSTSEAFGRTTAEFLSWGKPVIGRDSGATPELLDNNSIGILYVGNTEALAQAMLRLGEFRQTLPAMSQRASKYALERFSLERMTKRAKHLLDQNV